MTKYAGGVIGTPAAYGTSPGPVLAQQVNAFVTNTPSVYVIQPPLQNPVPTLPKPPAPIPVLTNSNPCVTNVPGDAPISQAATAQIIAGRPGLRILICHERMTAGAAEQVSEMEGTGSNCGTGTVYHSGSSTAANGEQLAANGGFETTVPFYLLPGNNYCIQQAGTARVAGKVSYLYVP